MGRGLVDAAADGRRPDRPHRRRALRRDRLHAPERVDRRSGRPLVLPAAGERQPNRLRARELPQRSLRVPGPRGLEFVVCDPTPCSSTQSTSGRCSSRSSHVLFKSGEIQDVESTRRARARGRRARRPRRVPVRGVVPLDVTALDRRLRRRRLGQVALRWPGRRLALRAAGSDRAARAAFTGWQAHARPFAFEPELRYADGIARSSPGRRRPRALRMQPGYDLIEEIGVERIRANSLRQTQR